MLVLVCYNLNSDLTSALLFFRELHVQIYKLIHTISVKVLNANNIHASEIPTKKGPNKFTL